MLNIRGTPWHELNNNDIKEFLNALSGEVDNDENFFFEFKDSKVKNQKIINELCALSNTYGGYIFIGVSDEKEVIGCDDWTEERIQNMVCDSITPLPNYDIREFVVSGKKIIIIKVNQGSRPPYITNNGDIFERISSGCRKIISAERLSAIYKRNRERQERLERRLVVEPINADRSNFPNNIVAVVDLGFEIVTNDELNFQREFYRHNSKEILDKFTEEGITSVYRVGNSINVTFGNVTQNFGKTEIDTMLQPGINNFMVIYPEGAVKMRCVLSVYGDGNVYIDHIITSLSAYRRVYEYLFTDFFEKFVYASKYEQLHVVKSFRPCFTRNLVDALDEGEFSVGNVIFTGGRIPSYGYMQIDRQYFEDANVEYTSKSLLDLLFFSHYFNMGMI